MVVGLVGLLPETSFDFLLFLYDGGSRALTCLEKREELFSVFCGEIVAATIGKKIIFGALSRNNCANPVPNIVKPYFGSHRPFKKYTRNLHFVEYF